MRNSSLLPSPLSLDGLNLSGTSMASYQGKDLFSGMPVGILLKVVAFLPSTAQFQVLSQVSPYLRKLMKTNIKSITNAAIKSQFSAKSAFLGCEYKDGWLLPTHPALIHFEEAIKRLCTAWSIGDPEWRYDGWELKYTISETPGPQFLFMLERGLVVSQQLREDLPRRSVSAQFQYLDVQGVQTLSELGSSCRMQIDADRFQRLALNGGFKHGDHEEPNGLIEGMNISNGLGLLPVVVHMFNKAIPFSPEGFGISLISLADSLQVLNCAGKYLCPFEEWIEDHILRRGLDSETKPKSSMTWYHGVPGWFVARPRDAIWEERNAYALISTNPNILEPQLTYSALDYIWFMPTESTTG